MRNSNILKTYSGLPRSIYIVFFARIINSMGSFVHPFLTLFLTKSMGLGLKTVGLFLMMSALSSIPGSLIGGKLSDHIGRKKIIIIFQGLAALCLIPCAFLGKSIIIPYLLILSSFFGGAVQPANSAMMADLTNTENRKSAYSLLYLGINIGFSLGPLIAGFLYNHYLKILFLGDAATTILSLILVAVFVEETLPAKTITEDKVINDFYNENEKAEEGSLLSVLLKRPYLIAFATISMIYSFMYSQFGFITPMQMDKLFSAEGPKLYGSIMAINGVVVVTMTTIIAAVTKKLRPIFNIALAGLFFSIGFGMLFLAKTFTVFVISTIVWTIGEILSATNSGVYIANHTPMSHRGRFNSVIPLITGAGFAIGPFMMSLFIKNREVNSAWLLVFFFGILASTCMYLLYLNEKKKEA
ncbi:MFS transporter [Clostridium tagluense]|uniref:MDR family MFS transporter n=1 Tax=Clostridium tagluense TaxID=360422 RepID=UPI001C0D69A6|nr:MFS transporter [Clostridium tagluense]MBU3128169.1 MFS transporter [Clostridium tagluense]MCB2312210.1 MFS transporter [Clostridium tagluense]MCB2316797.1 MFS transporter [Clostridium tagluense]MCB2321657.1 MFS transporter [Clostridium tagluense]MCB2326666.1 MFS transporter [Clostridium tagluense]